MELVMTEQRKKMHPHKFILWIAISSITLMFAGLTSAYIIKRNQPNWLEFKLPVIFWYSTATIAISSVTIWLAVRAFRQGEMSKYRALASGLNAYHNQVRSREPPPRFYRHTGPPRRSWPSAGVGVR